MVKVKYKGYKAVRYWDFVFLNYKGDELLYCCVAPNYALALQSFVRFMDAAKFKLVSCTTDGVRYALH